ncbi:unnamed protein product [Caenorhabditis brenneri]
MTDIFLNDPVALRHCILYEFVGGVPVFQAWKNFCEKVGENAINYVDYEYWYMRFSQKKFDLNHDRSKDPATRSITQMPIEILDTVLKNLKPMERFVARKVCKKFRACVDNHALEFKYFEVSTLLIRYDRKSKLPFEELCFSGENEMYEQMENLVTQCETPVELNTYSLRISFTGTAPVEQFVFSIVNFDILTISLYENAPKAEEEISKAVERVKRICEVTETKQHVTFLLEYFDALPIESFLNFNSIRFAPKGLTSIEVIGNYLRILLSSTAINYLFFWLVADSVAIEEFITNQLQLQPVDGEIDKFRAPIPGTNEHYLVEIIDSSIEITREVTNEEQEEDDE